MLVYKFFLHGWVFFNIIYTFILQTNSSHPCDKNRRGMNTCKPSTKNYNNNNNNNNNHHLKFMIYLELLKLDQQQSYLL